MTESSGGHRTPDLMEPLRHECPHCGADRGDACEEIGPYGPTGVLRSPHPERRELAEEVDRDE